MLETDVGRERDHVQMLTEDLERRRVEGELLATRERRVREQMESVAARAHADREETLRLARDMVQSAEEARLAVVDEMDRLRAALAAEQASLVEVEQERALVSQDAAQREADLARARQMIEQLETSRTNANAELARARARLVETESELLAAQHEYQLAQVQIDKLCSAHDDLVEDRAQLVARLHQAKEREARLRLRITGLEQRIQSVHEGTPAAGTDAEAESALDATASGLALELSRSEERARVLEAELVKAKAATSAASLRVDILQEQARKAEQARIAAETELRASRDTRPASGTPDRPPVPEPVRASPDLLTRLPSAEASTAVEAAPEVASGEPITTSPGPVEAGAVSSPHWSVAMADEPVDVEEPSSTAADAEACTPVELEPLVAMEDDPPTTDDVDETAELMSADPPAVDVAIEPAPIADDHADESPAVAAVVVAVVDGTSAWSGDDAVTTHVLSPAEATPDRIRELAPACGVVNLADAGAFDAVVALRAADVALPLYGCVADGLHALALGRVDVVTRPVDPERVRVRLEALAPRGANVIMVGSESGILIPLRQGVQQAGMSVRTAWNRAQAVQLADTVHPDVVIVDVAAEATEAADLLCDLARRPNAPTLVLVVGTPAHQDELRTALLAKTRDAAVVDRTALLHEAAALG
jgi:CheY-like chemotaxis protein